MGFDAFYSFKSGYNTIIYDDDSIIREYFSKLRDVNKMTSQQLVEAGKNTARKVVFGQCGDVEINQSRPKKFHSYNKPRRNYERLGNKGYKGSFRNKNLDSSGNR